MFASEQANNYSDQTKSTLRTNASKCKKKTKTLRQAIRRVCNLGFKFPHIWEMMATSECWGAADTHISKQIWRRIRHGKRPQREDGGRFHTSFSHTVQAPNAAVSGPSGVKCLPYQILTPENDELSKEAAFLALNVPPTNPTKPLTGSLPRAVRNDDVSVLKVRSSALWWHPVPIAFTNTGGRTLKWWCQTSSEELWSIFNSRMVSPSALVPHCMQLVPLVVLSAPAPQTSWDRHRAGVQPVGASAHLRIFRCLLVFVLSFIPWRGKKNLAATKKGNRPCEH